MNFDDGYTEEDGEIRFRRLLEPERKRVNELIRKGESFKAEEILFKPPYTFARWPLKETEKRHLFIQLMEWNDEAIHLQNLKDGLQLFCKEPLLAVRDCATCREWWFDEETGLISQGGGVNRRRPKHAKVACDTDRGCPKGHYDRPKGLSERNWAAVNHYVEWNEVGCPHPECPLMRRNWKWIGMCFKRYGHPAIHGELRNSSAG